MDILQTTGKLSRNTAGANQHSKSSLLTQYPNLPALIQGYINDGAEINDIPSLLLAEHMITIRQDALFSVLRSLQRIASNAKVKTVKRNTLSDEDKVYHVLNVTSLDPGGKWGCRLVKEKLARNGIHISRNDINVIRKLQDPQGTAARHPVTRKVHRHGLYSAGPNEEWCLDGHEKLLNTMGIAVYGIVDKYSRMELSLTAVPNARLADVPPILYLRLVKEQRGMPVLTTSDMGTEVSKLIPLVNAIRNIAQPFISTDEIPAFRTTKSVYNITRERGWRPIFEKDLSNVLYFYESGKVRIGFQPDDMLHKYAALWVWGHVVQGVLDGLLAEGRTHRVRKQAKSLLPTGGRRIDFYSRPEKFNGRDLLIPLSSEDIDKYIALYDVPEVTQFGTSESVAFCLRRYSELGKPALTQKSAWLVFAMILELPIPMPWSPLIVEQD